MNFKRSLLIYAISLSIVASPLSSHAMNAEKMSLEEINAEIALREGPLVQNKEDAVVVTAVAAYQQGRYKKYSDNDKVNKVGRLMLGSAFIVFATGTPFAIQEQILNSNELKALKAFEGEADWASRRVIELLGRQGPKMTRMETITALNAIGSQIDPANFDHVVQIIAKGVVKNNYVYYGFKQAKELLLKSGRKSTIAEAVARAARATTVTKYVATIGALIGIAGLGWGLLNDMYFLMQATIEPTFDTSHAPFSPQQQADYDAKVAELKKLEDSGNEQALKEKIQDNMTKAIFVLAGAKQTQLELNYLYQLRQERLQHPSSR